MSETLIIVIVVAVLVVVALAIGYQSAKKIWGRVTWWNIVPAIVVGIVASAAGGKTQTKSKKPEQSKSATTVNLKMYWIKIGRYGGKTEYYWDGEYLRGSNGKPLFEYSRDIVRRFAGPQTYRVTGNTIRASNGKPILDISKGEIRRIGGPVEYTFDGRHLAPFGQTTTWRASSPIPTAVMLVAAGILQAPQ